MLLIPCPYCGERPELEFRYGGQAHIARPENPAALSEEARELRARKRADLGADPPDVRAVGDGEHQRGAVAREAPAALAFERVVRRPLSETDVPTEPLVILVDALDEALTLRADETIVNLIADAIGGGDLLESLHEPPGPIALLRGDHRQAHPAARGQHVVECPDAPGRAVRPLPLVDLGLGLPFLQGARTSGARD